MDELTGFPRYQYSIFLKNGKEEQIVIRSNDWEDFKEAKSHVNEIIEKRAEVKTGPENQPVQTNSTAPVCAIHQVEMKWHEAGVSKTTGKPYKGFWACPEKNPDGTFCKYKPGTITRGVQ